MAPNVFLSNAATGLTLSADKLGIVSNTVGAHYVVAQCNRQLDVGPNSGKYYFEYNVGSVSIPNTIGGIAGVSSVLDSTSHAAVTAGTCTMLLGTMSVYSSGTVTGLQTPALAAYDTIGVHIDCVNKRMYYRKNASFGTKPITGRDVLVDGWDWSAYSGATVTPMIGVYTTYTAGNMTVNFGASPFVYGPPAGYTPVDPNVKLLCRTEDGNIYNYSGTGWLQVGTGEPTQAMFDAAMGFLPPIASCKALAGKYEVLCQTVGGGLPDVTRKLRIDGLPVLGEKYGVTVNLNKTGIQTAPPTPTLTYDTIPQRAPISVEVNGAVKVPYGDPVSLNGIAVDIVREDLNVGANNGVIKVKFGGTEELIPFVINVEAPGRSNTERTFTQVDAGYDRKARILETSDTTNIGLAGYAGINTVTVTYTGNPKFAVSFDGGATWKIRAASTTNQGDLICDFTAADKDKYTRPDTFIYDGNLKPAITTTMQGTSESNFSRYVFNADNYKVVQ